MLRRHLLASAAASLALPALPALAQQDWPNRPIRLVVPFPPGGPNDIIARLVAPQLTAALGQPIVIENRAGGGGTVGTDAAVKAAPDGYTFTITSGGTLVIGPHVYATMPYRVPEDIGLVSLVAKVPEVLVVPPALGVRTLAELVAKAKAQPGRLNFASTGSGGLPHLAGESFKAQAGIDIVHVPYRGAAPATVAMLANEVQMLFADVPVLLPHIRSGALVAVATASTARSASLPDVPTTVEQGFPELLADNWYAMVAPPRIPAPIMARMSQALRAASQSAAVREGLSGQGAEAVWTSPEDFAALVRTESAKWQRIAQASGARAD